MNNDVSVHKEFVTRMIASGTGQEKRNGGEPGVF
jgi:hypothetical protein